MDLLPVQYVACTNDAAFVMNCFVTYVDAENNILGSVGASDDFHVGQTRVIDVFEAGLPEGTTIWLYVNAILGSSSDGTPLLAYATIGQTATFTVQGTTLDYSVNLI